MAAVVLDGRDGQTRTHPYAKVETDGSPVNTKVVLVGPNGDEVDITTLCQRVSKEPGSPFVHVYLLALAPREHLHGVEDELDREFEVSV